MTRMASYRTAAPKGVFRYASHEAANQDREAWTIAKALELRGDARACGAQVPHTGGYPGAPSGSDRASIIHGIAAVEAP